MHLRLSDHPACPNRTVDRIDVLIERVSPRALHLRYTVTGRIADILVPPPGPPFRRDGLWKTTCFEAFLRPAGVGGYREFNFSPSGQWAAYDFTAYRDGRVQAALPAAPDMRLVAESEVLVLDVALAVDLRQEPYRLGLSAVIEERGGSKSLWALNHPGKAPDFHHHTCFAAELPPAPHP